MLLPILKPQRAADATHLASFCEYQLEMSAAAIQFFLTMRNQVKLYHWQTHSYARHKATDEAVESLDKNIDRFVEVYIGKYGRPKLAGKNATFHLENLTDKKAVEFVKECIKVLKTALVKDLTAESDSDLFNIRDEMLSDLNQLLYLFGLH
jgi:hypothetical protein